ncbi:substrate-binding domain-containing protein [Sulfobacillus harzensis]|uniref:LacI family transcriptional regulator n=1 Tax=Sulfobacillus harzensis TaxID=2729629 RepID=A0A7Y0L2A1_9FIRM|nr:LacI family transcriptional regulator [Sulfobacillus harzensis]
MENRKVTIADVAKRAKVSPASVSRYLNGVEGNLSPDTADRIRQAIDEMGYQPNAWARSLKTRRSGLLAVVAADLSNSYVPSVLDGIDSAANDAGYSLIIGNAKNDQSREAMLLERLHQQRIEGLVLQSTAEHSSGPLRSLMESGIPIMLIDRSVDGQSDLDLVALDNRGAISMALGHLRAQGFSQIIYVTDPPDMASSRRERELAVMASRSSWAAVRVVVRRDATPAALVEAIGDLLTDSERTAVLCSNAVATLYALDAIQAGGWAVPGELGLMMVDNPDWAPYVLGGITSVAQPTHDLGRQAAMRLLHRIRHPAIPPMEMRLPGQLIVRKSTQ